MAKPATQPAAPPRKAPLKAGRPFFGLIDAVVVPEPVEFDFDGALAHDDAQNIWTWMVRDLAPDLIDAAAPDDEASAEELAALLPQLTDRARVAVEKAALTSDDERRFRTQLGGEGAHLRLPMALTALRARLLLGKARSFGRAINAMTDEAALPEALKAMPLGDPPIVALLLQAAVGEVLQPQRMLTVAIEIAGGATDAVIARAGLAPLVDAILSHAQAQIAPLAQVGTFADIDLACRAIDRYHRLMRGVHTYLELERFGRWAQVAGGLTKTVSELIEPRLREVAPDVNRALRQAREGADRIDSDTVLSALNGAYLLTTVRDCRDSLALNALFEEVWGLVGTAIEMYTERNLDGFRRRPADPVLAARLEATIKLAELRFSTEYADVLRRARDAVEKRA